MKFGGKELCTFAQEEDGTVDVDAKKLYKLAFGKTVQCKMSLLFNSYFRRTT